MPFEVLPRGRSITIESTAAIDPKALAAGLRFRSGSLAAKRAGEGRRANIRVDDRFPLGPNTLFLSDLYTPEGERIAAGLEIPFFTIETAAEIPADVRVLSCTRVVVDGGRLRRATARDAAVHEVFKGVMSNSHKGWEAAFDPAGKAVDFEAIRGELLKARLERFGKVHPTLAQRLEDGDSTALNVAIWLRAELPKRTLKPTRGTVEKAPGAELAARRQFRELTRNFAERHSLFEQGGNTRLDEAAPVVYVQLDRDRIRRFATMDEVSAVFLYEPEGIDDLGDSMAIAQAGNAHALGYDGTGVNVAVYESGPDDTSNLQIADQFDANPATSQHSRHTHGIVKNIEGHQPHGHAPDCNLHSANSKDLAAIRWAAQDRGCTVISQSFHRESEQGSDELSFDDIYKDWLALNWPYPTICEAAGNGTDSEFVNHKGYNRLTVANHDDTATGLAGDTVFANPASDHGDRELPEIAANGMGVTAVGLTLGGTSMAAPAVAGSTACIQEVNGTLKSWPEGCRAIQLAAARLNPAGGTWWNDVNSSIDAQDGSGALNTLTAVRIAEQRKGRNNKAAPRGWDVGTLRTQDIAANDETSFSYRISVPRVPFFARITVKVALAWDSDVNELSIFGFRFPLSSVLLLDLDLMVYDSQDNQVGYSGSWDNSYEIAEFRATPGETYTVKIRRWSGTDDVWYGLAWNVTTTPFIVGDLFELPRGATIERSLE
jgi:hypothetical protein